MPKVYDPSMTPMKDTQARRLAIVALFVAIGSFTLGSAFSSPATEPDAHAVSLSVQSLNSRIADLEQRLADVEATPTADQFADVHERIDAMEAGDPTACMAYSSRHYVKERNGTRGKRYRMPLIVWNTAACPLTNFASRPSVRMLPR